MRSTLFLIPMAATAFLAAAAPPATKLPPAATAKVDFIKDVEPILAQRCHSCHGREAQQSGLRLDLRQAALRGGDYGPVIIPGKSAESKLIRRLVGGDGGMQMPPTGALSNEEIGILRAWIDQGADFRLEIKDLAPPKPVDPKLLSLIKAVRSGGNVEMARILDANPNLLEARDSAGSTALHHAAGFGSIETLQLLLDRGANPKISNHRKSTPLHWAVADAAKVRTLLQAGADVNAKQIEGRTAIFQAAAIGDGLASARLLIEKGADVNLPAANGQTPLQAASRGGNVAMMRLLLDAKAKVDAQAGNGMTALMAAATSGMPEAVRLLLEHGANPNLRTKKNETALADAATAGNEESVRMLLAKGAEVNVADERGYTPLMYAAGSDAMPAGIVKLLLEKGANRAAEAEGETAKSLAAKRGDTAVARLLSYDIPEAVAKATRLLEKQSHNFIRIGGCNSCHAQDLASAAAAQARHSGLSAPREIPQLPDSMRNSPERIMDLGAIGVGSVAWELFDSGMNETAKDSYTDAVVQYIKAMQTPDGHWKTTESRRPPMNAGDHQTAALAIYSLQKFSRDSEKAETAMAVSRAAAWLEKSKPLHTQDRAFHILGLAWANGNEDLVSTSTQVLASMQRADGGWSQLPGMESDAYATGQVLYALHNGGHMSANDPVYRKGVDYLLRTQAPDGSWHVKTRSIWFQPYFESGFPYSHDQWISAAGTAWATMALSLAHESGAISRK